MLSAPAPTPPPPPPPVRTDIVVEPDDQWKADLRKRIEHDLLHMVEDAQVVRDTILNSQPSEGSRERAHRDFEESMNNIRTLAQEEFTRLLRQEMSERKWALDVVVSNSPDVARQQQWILDSIRKADEERDPFPPTDAPQSAEEVLSASPQQLSDSEQGSEEGYGTGELEDEEGESEEIGDSTGEEEDGDEDGEEVDHNPRQSRPPSRPSVLMTQPLHSKSPVSRRNAPSHQRQPPNSQLAEGNDDDEADDVHRHPPRRHDSQGSQPYSPGGAPRRQSSGSQASVWRPFPRAPEPSGISRTFAHANGQVYNTGPVQFPRRGSVNSTGSTSSGAGLHRAGSMNSDHQYRSSSVAPHGSSERPSTQSRDRIASNISIAPRERQTSTSASPHDRPSPPTFPTAPRPIPGATRPSLDEAVRFPTSASPSSRGIYAMQRSPEDVRQGMPIPRGPTTPEEGPRGVSWGSSLNSRRSLGDFSVHRRHNSKGEQRLPPVNGDLSDASDDIVGQLDDRQSLRSTRSVRSTMSIEQLTAWWETEARKKEEEANRKEEEAKRKEEEARRLEESARRSLEEARRLEACAQQADASAKVREAAAQSKEAEAKHKEAEAKKREAAAQKREAEAQRKEEAARHRELEARRKEEQALRKEEQAQRKEDDARKREEEVRRKEDDARKREDDARRREEDARQREMLARQKEEDARRFEEEARKKEEEARKKEDEARRKEEEAGRRREEAKRSEEEYERKKREIERKEAELKKREAELLLKEQAARLAQEEAARQALESSRLEPESPSRDDDEDISRLEAEEAARADASNRAAEEAESTAREQERQQRANVRKASKAQAKRQKEKALEEQRRQKEIEEQQQQRLEEQRLLEVERQRLEEQRLLEERRREQEEQIRLDEELSRQEQERLDREALFEQERLLAATQEREANRLLEEQRRAVEEERLRVLEEQRRKADEKNRQRDEQRHHQQQHHDEVHRQRAREEQQREFQRREAQYYQRTLERERQNSMGAPIESWATPHRPGSTTGSTTGSAGDRSSASSTFSSSAGSTWSSRPTSMSSSHTTNTSSSIPFSTTPKPSPPSGVRPGGPGTSPHTPKLDEAEWARRAEERARIQQEQFKREQVRLESERQAKSSKMFGREELIRLYENHDNKWRQLRDSSINNLGWNSFAWPVFKRPSEPDDMTTVAISAYVLSNYAPDANTAKSAKDRIKDQLKRWHPDKFETRILHRVVEEEREKVKTGAGVVVRGLNEMLNKDYDD
jgi:hypothetical protein